MVFFNDEVKDGVSEWGGYLVECKFMQQWSMCIIVYVDWLLYGFDNVDWLESLKEQQCNWIGCFQGVSVKFVLEEMLDIKIEVFIIWVDIIYGVIFMVLVFEYEFVV